MNSTSQIHKYPRIYAMFMNGIDTMLCSQEDTWGLYASYIETCGTIILYTQDTYGFKELRCITEDELVQIEADVAAMYSDYEDYEQLIIYLLTDDNLIRYHLSIAQIREDRLMARIQLNKPVYDLDGHITTLADLLDAGKAYVVKCDHFGKNDVTRYFVDLVDSEGVTQGSFDIGQKAYESRAKKGQNVNPVTTPKEVNSVQINSDTLVIGDRAIPYAWDNEIEAYELATDNINDVKAMRLKGIVILSSHFASNGKFIIDFALGESHVQSKQHDHST